MLLASAVILQLYGRTNYPGIFAAVPLSVAAATPERMVRILDDLFSAFDRLAERHGLEKIKAIGDACMVVGGLPDPRPDHAQAVADMAMDLREEVVRHRDPGGRPLALRVGIDSGRWSRG